MNNYLTEDPIKNYLVMSGYIPLGKSWLNRVGTLDMFNGHSDIIDFLESHYNELNADLKALHKASTQWPNSPIYVGESGTLYRILRFYAWKHRMSVEFESDGTLVKRIEEMCNDPNIIDYPTKELLKLDNETTQWATASALSGNSERIDVSDPKLTKLRLTYEAIDHWKEKRKTGLCWDPRYDETIQDQCIVFLRRLRGEKVEFHPGYAEHYCFARALGYITPEYAKVEMPSLYGHETKRIKEMERALEAADNRYPVEAPDHRIVCAVAMKAAIEGRDVKFMYPDSVNKSWPQFWGFMKEAHYVASILNGILEST